MRLRRLPRGPTLLSSSFPSSLPPPAPPSAEDWSQSSHRAPCQGRTSPWKPWSKGLITLSLSILDDPLGLSDVNPLEGNVYSVCPSTPMPHSPPQPPEPRNAPGPLALITLLETAESLMAAGAKQHQECQSGPRGTQIQCKGQRKWLGIPGPSTQTCSTSLDFLHSFSLDSFLVRVMSMASVFLCDLSSGSRC